MKTKFIILSMTGILLISACNKSIIEEGLSGPSLFFGDASEESMLVFSNGEELREQILHPEKALPTTRCNNPKESFQSLMTSIEECDLKEDPILSYEYQTRLSVMEDKSETLYSLLGYDETVPNESFGRLLNKRGEFQVRDTIYKISSRGTYYFPVEKLDYFESNYPGLAQTGGIKIAERTYKLADDIYLYDTFSSDVIESEGVEADDSFAETRSSIPSFNWKNYLTMTGSVVFNDKIVTYSMNKSKQLKTRIYYHNYVVYKERGVYAKVENKKLLNWKDVQSEVINITWNNLIFTAPYNGRKPTGERIICSGTGSDFSWQDKLCRYIMIRHYSIPESRYADYVKWNRGKLNSFIKEETGIDVSGYEVIIFEGKEYVQIVIHGTAVFEKTNIIELKRLFNCNWFDAIPKPVAGQFMYAAVNEGVFGALRVGTAF